MIHSYFHRFFPAVAHTFVIDYFGILGTISEIALLGFTKRESFLPNRYFKFSSHIILLMSEGATGGVL